MNSIRIFVSLAALSFMGYTALKYAFHKESAKEKMYKVLHPEPSFKRFPKWYAAALGIGSWLAVIYFISKLFLK